eukprot:TRINITY_DN7314_c0_g1_i2.p1 TRINITY_DN7314_c0_g1~~TRINITY_DN7314_c0_g1_i2.p1  ORF type:complete len:548 (-),score=137.87 TRINITY_DN7314_c0_g1_i2:28-1638(-)
MSQPRIKKGDIPVMRGGPIQKAILHSDDEDEKQDLEIEEEQPKSTGRNRTQSDEKRKAPPIQAEMKEAASPIVSPGKGKNLGAFRRSASVNYITAQVPENLHSSTDSIVERPMDSLDMTNDLGRTSNMGGKSPEEVASVRDTIIGEILQTEQDYIRNLDILVEKFSVPLKTDPNHGVSQQQASGIFSNVEIILMFHKAFVGELKMKKGNVGGIFFKYADFLKMYSEYLKNYDNALVILQGLKNNKKFQSFLQERRKDPVCKLPLTSYLIMPIQRVPRYELLLRELVKKTPKESDEYDALHQAYLRVQKVAQHINEIKRQVENAAKLFEIQNKIQGKLQAPILAPERQLVKEGVFDVIRESLLRGVYTRRYVLFLFNDMVLITTDTFDYKAMISMKHLIVHPWEIKELGQQGINIGTIVESLRFVMASSEERDTWLELLVSVKNKHNQIASDVMKRRQGKNHTVTVDLEDDYEDFYEPQLFLATHSMTSEPSSRANSTKDLFKPEVTRNVSDNLASHQEDEPEQTQSKIEKTTTNPE